MLVIIGKKPGTLVIMKLLISTLLKMSEGKKELQDG